MHPPTFEDILAAHQFIKPYLPKTPLIRIARISDELGCDYYAKLENLQPVGAFKVRGGVNLVGSISTAGGSSLSAQKSSARALRTLRLGGEGFSAETHRRGLLLVSIY